MKKCLGYHFYFQTTFCKKNYFSNFQITFFFKSYSSNWKNSFWKVLFKGSSWNRFCEMKIGMLDITLKLFCWLMVVLGAHRYSAGFVPKVLPESIVFLFFVCLFVCLFVFYKDWVQVDPPHTRKLKVLKVLNTLFISTKETFFYNDLKQAPTIWSFMVRQPHMLLNDSLLAKR